MHLVNRPPSPPRHKPERPRDLTRPPSARPPSFPRWPSERLDRLSAHPSDISQGFERVVSEHFGRVASVTDSAASVAHPPTNPAPAAGGLRVTLISVPSYGNTENGSFCDDANPNPNAFVGGMYTRMLPPDAVLSSQTSQTSGSFRRALPLPLPYNWSSPGLPPVSKVADAAGPLYRSVPFDVHWVINERLGAGACSEVRLAVARDKGDMRRVGVKIVSKSVSGAPDLFTPEGECREVVAFKIAGHHPNVVACTDVYEDERFIYLVLELLSGGQMLPRIASKHFYPSYNENDVITLVRGLTHALSHLHQLGIAHRDVKPENVLFASDSLDPVVKLTDFGISYNSCLTSDAHDMVGTPLYVAPEVLLRRPYGCLADMWSLGVVVHILLTGAPPFDDDNLVQLVNLVKQAPVKFDSDIWSYVSDSARDFVSQLLTRDLSKRLTAAQALAHPWLATPRPPTFPAPPPSPRAQQSSPRSPASPKQRVETASPGSLLLAQANINKFVMRKEGKRVVDSVMSENLKLSMLVSLSEKDLGVSESFETHMKGDSTLHVFSASPSSTSSSSSSSSSSILPESTRVTATGAPSSPSAMGDKDGVMTKTSGLRKKIKRKKKRVTDDGDITRSGRERTVDPSRQRAKSAAPPQRPTRISREDTDLSHQIEQERLRQQRLQTLAELQRKKCEAQKMDANGEKGRRSEALSEPTVSVATDTMSSRSSCSQVEEGNDLPMSYSTFVEDSIHLSESLLERERRDADAQADVDTIRQRGKTGTKSQGAKNGRRAKQANQTKQSGPTKGGGIGDKGKTPRRHGVLTTVAGLRRPRGSG